MKRSLLLLALACTAAIADDMVARDGKDYVRITQAPCPPAVLTHIPEGRRGPFRAAYVSVDGFDFVACWAMRTDGLVFLQYADGDFGTIARELFALEPGI